MTIPKQLQHRLYQLEQLETPSRDTPIPRALKQLIDLQLIAINCQLIDLQLK